MTRLAEPLPTPVANLGEGPRVDAASGTLAWVDIRAGELWQADLDVRAPIRESLRSPRRVLTIEGRLGCAAFVDAHGPAWLLAAEDSVVLRSADGQEQVLAVLEPDHPGQVRLNDGAVAPDGSFWIGSMRLDGGTDRWGRLHRLTASGRSRLETSHEVVLDGLVVSNGLGWTADGTLTYLADSGDRVVHRLVRQRTGWTRRGQLLDLSSAAGVPDGLTVDDDDHVWVAVWDAGTVVRVRPDGRVVETVEVPCSRPTACALAGSRLVVTTAYVEGEPGSGRLHAVDVDVPGQPARRAVGFAR